MKTLSSEKIELINAHGPYNHSVWTYEGVTITNEERLAGRVDLIAKKIRESILKNFTMAEIQEMSIVDIGCYDGWILQQLSDLPFAEIVGVEPRESNINKAKEIRELLGIQSRIRFEMGDIDSIGKQKFDIVICTGVLHHVACISMAIHQLRSICNKMLFVETICLSSTHITKSLKKEIEMKDIAYFDRAKICGITGQKFESSYYDGSTNKMEVVSVPSVESLLMYLEIEGFDNIQTVIDPRSYSPIWKKKGRLANAVAICALAGKDDNTLMSNESESIANYELGLMKTVLDRRFIEPLYKVFHLREKYFPTSIFVLNSLLYVRSSNWLSGLFWSINKVWLKNESALEIVKNLKYNPEDKLCLEYGKILYKEQDYEKAISVLKDITHKVNADWRSVYRSFCLLSKIYRELGQEREAERYKELCLISNSKFPFGLNMNRETVEPEARM